MIEDTLEPERRKLMEAIAERFFEIHKEASVKLEGESELEMGRFSTTLGQGAEVEVRLHISGLAEQLVLHGYAVGDGLARDLVQRAMGKLGVNPDDEDELYSKLDEALVGWSGPSKEVLYS